MGLLVLIYGFYQAVTETYWENGTPDTKLNKMNHV